MLHIVFQGIAFCEDDRGRDLTGSLHLPTTRTCTSSALKNPKGCGNPRVTRYSTLESLAKAKSNMKEKMSLLRVSRQLHLEATHVFLATNVFAFDQGISFLRFRLHVNPKALKAIRMVHLSFGCWRYSPLLDYARLESRHDNITFLSNLRKPYTHIRMEKKTDEKQWASNMGVDDLRLLALEEVSVEMDDSCRRVWSSLPASLYSHRERREWCERPRAYLMEEKTYS